MNYTRDRMQVILKWMNNIIKYKKRKKKRRKIDYGKFLKAKIIVRKYLSVK